MSLEKRLSHFKGYLIGRRYGNATKALQLMRKQFHLQVRKDGVTPVYSHSLQVAALLRTYEFNESMEEKVLIVALLHDILEDTDFMSKDMSAQFGEEITDAVARLTKGSVYNNGAYYDGILASRLSTIVKIADRFHNLSTMLGAFSIEKIEKYIKETEDYVLPLIKRARGEYPEQEAYFENMKLVINVQLDFARAVVANGKVVE